MFLLVKAHRYVQLLIQSKTHWCTHLIIQSKLINTIKLNDIQSNTFDEIENEV